MKINYTLDELPEKYQEKFKYGFNLKETKGFYPSSTEFWLNLIYVIAVGIPGMVVVVLGFWILFSNNPFHENSPLSNETDFKKWFIFISLGILAIAGLLGICHLVIRLFRGFLFQMKIRNLKNEKDIMQYGLYLDDHLVYRALLEDEFVMISKEAIVKAENHSAPGVKQNITVNHVIYYDKDLEKELFIEIGNGAFDEKYKDGKKIYQIINQWKGIT